MDNNELMHYGVLGMKLGKRRAVSNVSSGRSQRKSKKHLAPNPIKPRPKSQEKPKLRRLLKSVQRLLVQH